MLNLRNYVSGTLLSPRPDTACFIFRIVITGMHVGSMPTPLTLTAVLTPVIVCHSNGMQQLRLHTHPAMSVDSLVSAET